MPHTATRSRTAALLGVLLALALGAGALGGTLWAFGTTAPLMARWLDWDAVPASAGLTEADRQPLAALIADTMAGRTDAFQYKGLFSEQAETHMLDCAPLFRLARTVGIAAFGVFFAALGACLALRDWRHSARGMLIGAGILLLLCLALLVWGLIGFDSLFTAFHRAFFTNDLWLFPADDLLIRLMPTAFFVRYAALGGGLWLACLAAMAVLALLLLKKYGKKT